MTVEWNGKSSREFGLKLQSSIDFNGVERDVEELDIPGRNGIVIQDNKRFKPVEQNFKFTIFLLDPKNLLEKQIKEALAWVSNMTNFYTFTWIGEPDYIFKAKVNGKASANRNNGSFADFNVPVKLFPMKYLKGTYSKARTLKSGETFQSSGTQIAHPIITLTGTGNVTLTVNGKTFILKNVTGGVVIDCENQVVTDLAKKNSQMDKVYSYPFPTLKIGSNTISWDNLSFTGTIIERWCELA